MGIIRVNKTFPPEYQTWEPMSVELRSAWCRVMTRYYPIMLGPTMMGSVAAETNASGWHESGDWIQLAKEFDAAGFTPLEYRVLNDAVRADKRAEPRRKGERSKKYVSNRLITLSRGQGEFLGIRLRATDWLDWLTQVRAGRDPVGVAARMLEPHWGEFAQIIHE